MRLFRIFYSVLRFFRIKNSRFEVIFESNFNQLVMKRFVLFSFLNFCLIVSVLAQNQDKKQNLPKENSKVTKEYDEHGNLTKFDSVYTYSWSGDTTFQKSFSPKDFPEVFGNDFGFFQDSTFKGNSFFEDFGRLFANPLDGVRDSMFLKRFDQFHNFGNFNFNGDSIATNSNNFDDFLRQMNPDKNDSISSHSRRMPSYTVPRSMEDMMKMMQQRMKEMEEFQQQIFEEHQSSKNQKKAEAF